MQMEHEKVEFSLENSTFHISRVILRKPDFLMRIEHEIEWRGRKKGAN